MADEKPQQNAPEEESKKDTVRINLPPGLTGRSSTPTGGPPPAAKVKPPTPTGPPVDEDESKKSTAMMGTPITTPKPKKDTSRVQVSNAKPAGTEMPRPTVKLRREEATPAPAAAAVSAPVAAAAIAAAPSGADVGLSLAAMVLSLAVLGYLAFVAMG
jgi:hypothetical protein